METKSAIFMLEINTLATIAPELVDEHKIYRNLMEEKYLQIFHMQEHIHPWIFSSFFAIHSWERRMKFNQEIASVI